MEKIITFTIEHKGINKENNHKLNFIVERLKPFEQFNLIMRIISIISKGHHDSEKVEQILHNTFQTGKKIEKLGKDTEVNSLQLILDALKGALAELSDKDRDFLVNELLKNVKIDTGHPTLKLDATIEELNQRLDTFHPIFKLLAQVLKVNLGFL